jgi:hypothetical protein
MFITDATANAMLDAIFPTGTGTDRAYLSIHTDYSATGSNIHGSKTAGAWAGASSRQKGTTAAIDLTVTHSGSDITVKWVGAWGGSSGDTFRGMMPNGSTGAKSFQVDLTNDRIYCEGHGWSNTQKIVFYGDTAPTGLTAGTTYFVISVTAGDPDYFQVSATSGGSAINLTGQAGAGCAVSNITEEVYSASGTHRVSTYTINL